MMITSVARVPTASGSKYLQQLCKHWSHKLQVEFSETAGTVQFEDARARMSASPEALIVTIEAETPERLARLKDTMARHVDRFAFREAPLPFEWVDG